VPDPEAPGRRPELEGALRGHLAALGPAVAWRGAAQSARRAIAAHRLVENGALAGGGLVLADDHLADLILHSERALLEDLALRRLAPLDEETPRSRERLAETLRAWLDHQGDVSATAAALHVHPQTVRYRLGRLRERFGTELEDPRARFELTLALRA
jgi:DNA-binding PucR family transcriptional regulator